MPTLPLAGDDERVPWVWGSMSGLTVHSRAP